MTRFFAVFAAALIVGLGAQSAARSAVAPAHRSRGWMAPNANSKHPWMYVASGTSSVVAIYDLSGPVAPHKIGEITQGLNRPAGLSVDAQGTLYAANYRNGNTGGTVTIYPAGSHTPSLTLSQGLSVPIDTAVDTNGDVYVANRGSAPSIVVYPPGQTTPSRTITSSLIQNPAQLQFDSARNLYFSDGNTGISEVTYGSQQPFSLNLQGPGGVASGLAVDRRNGNLFVSWIHGPNQVVAYAPGNKVPLRTLKGVGF